MTDSEIKPALQPHEWDGGETWYPTVALSTTGGGDVSVWDGKSGDDSHFVTVADCDRHALAALCLYKQLYGFTQEDVALLRSIAHNAALGLRLGDIQPADDVRSLADRIAALLPPVPPER